MQARPAEPRQAERQPFLAGVGPGPGLAAGARGTAFALSRLAEGKSPALQNGTAKALGGENCSLSPCVVKTTTTTTTTYMLLTAVSPSSNAETPTLAVASFSKTHQGKEPRVQTKASSQDPRLRVVWTLIVPRHLSPNPEICSHTHTPALLSLRNAEGTDQRIPEMAPRHCCPPRHLLLSLLKPLCCSSPQPAKSTTPSQSEAGVIYCERTFKCFGHIWKSG